MSTIADAKVAHNYNCYNGYFFGGLRITAPKAIFLLQSSAQLFLMRWQFDTALQFGDTKFVLCHNP